MDCIIIYKLTNRNQFHMYGQGKLQKVLNLPDISLYITARYPHVLYKNKEQVKEDSIFDRLSAF